MQLSCVTSGHTTHLDTTKTRAFIESIFFCFVHVLHRTCGHIWITKSRILVTEVEEKLCYKFSNREVVFGLLEDGETRGFLRSNISETDWNVIMRMGPILTLLFEHERTQV